MLKVVYTCKCCAQPFTPLPNNRSRQIYCTRNGCKRRRRRERQRKWHKARYAEDKTFQAAAKGRVKQKRRRDKARSAIAPAAASVSGARLDRVSQAVLGLAVQLGEDDDPVRAAALVASWTDRGARLEIGLGAGP